jgi:hypothetical protein
MGICEDRGGDMQRYAEKMEAAIHRDGDGKHIYSKWIL